MSDITVSFDSKKLSCFIVTMDIEKAFDTLVFLMLVLILGCGYNFMNWIESLLKDQKSSIINGGKTTPYFALKRSGRQDDPILALLFALSFEMLSLLIQKI